MKDNNYFHICWFGLFLLIVSGCEKPINSSKEVAGNDTATSVALVASAEAVVMRNQLVLPTTDSAMGNTATASAEISSLALRNGQELLLDMSMLPTDATANGMGSTLSISGSIAIIGTYANENQSGAAFIVEHDRVSNIWKNTVALQVDNMSANAQYGQAVAIKGNTALVSAPANNNGQGTVFVFKKNDISGQWNNNANLAAPTSVNIIPLAFGKTMAFNGNTIAISAQTKNTNDATLLNVIYIYVLTANNWTLAKSIRLASNTQPFNFDQSLALAENTLVIGMSKADSNGAVLIYERIGETWGQSLKLLPTDDTIVDFGQSVAINGNTLVITGTNAASAIGQVSIYAKDRASKRWYLQQHVVSEDASLSLGRAMTIVGDIMLLGATSNTNNSGMVHVLRKQNNQWTRLNTITPKTTGNTSFGQTVTANNKIAFIAAPQHQSIDGMMGEINIFPLHIDSSIGTRTTPGSRRDTQAQNRPPDDPDLFLSLVTRNSPIIVESEESARAYYAAVDPQNRKTTLNRWRREVGFTRADPVAIYVNAADLGFSRRMYSRINDDLSIASYVENFATLEDAVNDVNLIATVAMEMAPPALDPNGTPFVSFYVFGPDDRRDLGADLDGRGFKFQPGLCTPCHGGVTKSLVNGRFPDGGDIDALFLPYDIDTYVFLDNSRRFSKAAQEENLKRLNEIVLFSYELMDPTIDTSVPAGLIEGWYGGPGLPNQFFNEFFVPEGWLPPAAPASAAQLYLQTIGPKCRACHIQRGLMLQSDLDLGSYDKFISYADIIEDMVFNRGVMPLAKLTFENFWADPVNPQLLAEHLPNFGGFSLNALGVVEPGRPIANAGISRMAPMRRVTLRSSASLFAETVRWRTIQTPQNSNIRLNGRRTSTPSFTPDVAGEYEFQLNVTNRFGDISEPSFVTITASPSINRASFSDDIVPILQNDDCLICHINPAVKNFVDNRDLYQSVFEMINFVDPESSVLVTKPSGLHHNARGRPGFIEPDTSSRDMILRWITEGARNN